MHVHHSSLSAASSSAASSVSSSTSHVTTAAAYARSLLHRTRSLPSVTSVKSFPTIELTPEEQAHYDRVVGRVLYRTVQEYASYRGEVNRELWSPVRKNQNMAIYRSVKRSEDPLLSLMLGVGKIDGSLEDVMDGLYADNTTDLRCVKAFLKSKVIAGTVLNVSEKRTPDDPFSFAGLKWFAAKTPGGPVSHDRDLLTYERQGMTLDADGNEIAYHLLQSVDRPEWPPNTFKNVIRSHASICYLYKCSGNKVESFFLGEFYASGSFPQRISDYGIAGKWLTVVNSVKCSEARKLSQLKESAVARARVSDSSVTMCEANICHVCKERRSSFTLCAGCHQNACKSCCEEKKLFELDDSGRPLTDKFCKKCITKVARQRGSRIYWDGVDAELPPAFIDHMFAHFTESGASTVIPEDSIADDALSSYFDSALGRNLNMESVTSSFSVRSSYSSNSFVDGDGLLDNSNSSLDELIRRRKSHVDRLSNRSYTKEQLLADLALSSR